MSPNREYLDTRYGSTWHDSPNGWTVMVIHRPGSRAVCFVRPGADDTISLPYSVTADQFDPIYEALEAAYRMGQAANQEHP